MGRSFEDWWAHAKTQSPPAPAHWGPLTREAYVLRRKLDRSLNNRGGDYGQRWRIWLACWRRFKRRFAAGV